MPKFYDVKDQNGQEYKVWANSQTEAADQFLAAGIAAPQKEFLTNPDGSMQLGPMGELIEDPRTTAAQIRARETVDKFTNPKRVVPTVMELGGEAVGTIGGTLAGATVAPVAPFTAPAGGIAGGAAVGAAGRYAGERIMGTSPEEAWAKSKDTALWSAAGGTVFEGLRLFRGWFRGFGPILKPSEMALLKNMRPEYEDVARQIGATPRADQLVDWNVTGPNMDREQVNLVRRVGESLTTGANVDEEARRIAGDYDAIYKYLNPTPAQGPGYLNEAGVPFDVALNQEYRRIVGSAEGELKKSTQQLAAASAKIPGADEVIPIGEQAAIALQELAQNGKKEVDSLYDTYRQAIGQKMPGMPYSTTTVARPQWIAEYVDVINSASKDAALTVDQRKSFESIKDAIFTKDAQVDLAALDDAIVQQGRRVSDLKANSNPKNPTSIVREMGLLDNLKKWRMEVMDTLPEEANAAYVAAQRAYGEYADKFEKGLVGKLMSHNRDGDIIISDPAPLIRLFSSGDISAIRQIQTLANKSLPLKQELRKLAFAHYRAVVMDKDGVIDLAKHNKYMASVMEGGYKELTQGFFDKRDWALIQRGGGYAKVMLDKEKQLKDMEEKWKSILGGRFKTLEDVSPQRFVTMLFPTTGSHKIMEPGMVRYAMNVLKKYDPDALPAYQDAVRTYMMNRITGSSGELSLPRLRAMVEEGSVGKNLEAVLGEEYMTRLQNVIGYMDRMRFQRLMPGGIASGGPNILESARKGLFGPLSHESFIAGIAGQWRAQANQQALYQALTDPSSLKALESYYARLSAKMFVANYTGVLLKPEDEAND